MPELRGWLLALVLAVPAQAAVSCTASVTPSTIRAEGVAEQTSDIVLTCTGGTPTPFAVPVPQGNLTVFLNTAATSRTFNSSRAAEALLLIDEPGSASNPRQRLCGNIDGCTIIGAGPGGVRYDGSGGHSNIFQGTVAGNNVVFSGIPFDPAPAGSRRILRIANLRADASGIAAGTQAIASLGVSANLSLQILNPVFSLASAQPGLAFSARNGSDPSALLGPSGFQMTTGDTSRSATPGAYLRFTPAFATAFRTQSGESGFTLAVSGGAAGAADSGTRLKASLNNVPAGVRVWVGLTNNGGGGSARLVRSESGSFDPAPRTDTFGSISAAEVTISAGSGAAVWEIAAAANQNYDFPVWFTGTNAQAGTGVVNGSLAPLRSNTTTGIPRFADTSHPVNLLTVGPLIILSATPESLLFRASPGVIALPQIIALGVSGANGSQVFLATASADRGGNWLRATSAGDTAFGCTVSVDASQLPAGFYSGTVRLQIANSSASAIVPVSLVVMQAAASSGASQIFSHIADGGNWKTAINLINTDTVPASFTLRFWDPNGNPWRVPLGPDGFQTQIFGTLPVGGSRTLQTVGFAGAVSVGWAELISTSSIGGTAIFSELEPGLPDSEAAVPSTPLKTRRFLLPFDSSGGTGTGVAIANPDPAQGAQISVVYRDPFGQTTFTGGPFYVPPRGHISFVLPAAAGVEGVAEFTSTADIVGLGIRGHGRLFTSLETLSRVPAGNKTITHIAEGAGWKTSIILVNASTEPARFTLRFWGDNANALTLSLGSDGRHSSITGAIAPGGSRTIRTDGTASSLVIGWAELASTGMIGGTAIFAAKTPGQPDSEAAVPIAAGGARRFVLPVDGSSGFATGVAFGNPAVRTNVTVTFRTEAGLPVPAPASFSVPAHGHFSTVLPVNLRGVAEINASTPISALGIRGHNQAFTSVRTLVLGPALSDVAASIVAITAGDAAAPLAPFANDWVPLVSGDFNTPSPSVFVAARPYGLGRVAAAGDEGLLVNSHLLDNAAFVTNLLAWLDPAGQRALAWSSGHGELTTAPSASLAGALDDRGFSVARLRQPISAASLAGVSVLIAGNGQSDFTVAEMQTLDDFVAAGGGLLLLGNAASWLAAHSGSTADAYPMTRVSLPFGLAFPAGVIKDPDPQDQLAGATIFRTFYPYARQ